MKNQNVFNKIKEEYEKYGITINGDLQKDKLNMNCLEKCEYAEYVVKETLRIESLTPETAYNEVIDDTEIWGVPIK